MHLCRICFKATYADHLLEWLGYRFLTFMLYTINAF